MNVNDESLKKLTTVLTNDKKKEITKLPWKHGFAD
mgnify:FL=1